ncbi:MAG: type II secretion system protein GspE, partial [bacterium]|nr:type II secretion system protein GspE [bacterium]
QRKHALVPVNRVGGSLIIAMADPSNIHAIDDVKFITNLHVEVVVASEAAIRRKIDKHFPRPH